MKFKTFQYVSLRLLLVAFISCSVGSNLSIYDSEATHSDYLGVDLGVVKIGANVEKTLMVKNTTNYTQVDMRDDSILPEGFEFRGGQYPGIGGTCGEELEPSAECSIVIDFRPSVEKIVEGKLTLTSESKWSVPTPPHATEPFSGKSNSSISIRGTGKQ